MSSNAPPDTQGSSTRPYLIRALHEWCSDNGFTPYLAVYVDRSVQVPAEYVKNDEIVLNVGYEATSGLKLGNEAIEFRARFGGTARDIVVPVDHVVAIYARENGQGMAFPAPVARPAEAAEPATPAAKGLRLAGAEPRVEPKVEPPPRSEPPAADAPAPRAGWSDDAPEPTPPGPPRPTLKRIK